MDTFRFLDVGSVGLIGDPSNELLAVTSAAATPYTLGTLTWSGTASGTHDPDDEDVFPSWGVDLGIRVTHVPSGTHADILLGSGGEIGPGPAPYAGSSRALGGVPIQPGDEFVFEFLEGFDDPIVAPDAVWNSIEFSLSDDAVAPLGPPGDGMVRLSTIGRNTFPTFAGEEGAEFFRIEYGAGSGPAILQAVLNTHAEDKDDLWFDSDETGESPATDGSFRASFLEGPAPPLASFEAEDPDPSFAGDFGVLRLTFAPDDFHAGDSIHFGIDTDGGFDRLPTGDAFASLVPPLTFTLLFEDGTLAANNQWRIRPDVENAAMVTVDMRGRQLRADFDLDRDVDGDDLLNLLLHFGQKVTATHAQGDTDGNGSVDMADTRVWQEQVGRAFPPRDVTLGGPVPEPSSAILAAALVFTGLLWKRTAQKRSEGVVRRCD